MNKPSLESAYLRVGRAYEHLAEMKRLHDKVCTAQAQATVVKYNRNITIEFGKMTPVMMVETGAAPIPDRISIFIADIVSNLRAALNYMVTQLAILDSGKKGKRLQFPIESTPNSFHGREKEFLEGLSDSHIALIEDLQPYKGCQWTELLQRLSNFNGHHDLVMVTHDYRIDAKIVMVDSTDLQASQGSMEMNLQPLLHISLSDGMPVMETLEVLHSQVSQTLDVFNTFFEGTV